MASMKDSVPRCLYTKRLVLELFDHNIPAHYECLLGSMNNPTAHSRMGDFAIRTAAQFDALNAATCLSSIYCQGLVPDFDFYYILRIGDEDRPMIGGISLAQRNSSVPPDIGWCILEPYMGKGYATEGAMEFLRFLREDFGLQDVITWPGSNNRESRRVAEKLGFVEAGNVRSKDEPEKVDVVYSLRKGPIDGKTLELSMWGDEGPPGED